MPIDPATLSALATAYASGMTSIRGRRVQRLLKREFAGAAYVLPVRLGAGTSAVLGLSASGAALCATDGTGRQATVVKWLHGAAKGIETGFDLHKDSLPVLVTKAVPLARFASMGRLHVPTRDVVPGARKLVAKVRQVLAAPHMKPESERLRYEYVTRGHAAELQAELCDPRVYAHVDGRRAPTPRELADAFARKEAGAPPQRTCETWIDCVVRLKKAGKAIGRVEATVLDDRAEVAYLLGYVHWGNGHAQEAVAWLHALLTKEHGVLDFWATVTPGNQRSIALLGRLGYVESPKASWPGRLLTYNDGDRVFHRSAALRGRPPPLEQRAATIAK